jgi:hypothetical protein
VTSRFIEATGRFTRLACNFFAKRRRDVRVVRKFVSNKCNVVEARSNVVRTTGSAGLKPQRYSRVAWPESTQRAPLPGPKGRLH